MIFQSSTITSTATRAAMMAMPIVDITNEKLSSISQMDLNRKVTTASNHRIWLNMNIQRIRNGSQIMKIRNHWFIVLEKMFIIIWWRHQTVLLIVGHTKVELFPQLWRFVNGRQPLTVSELPSDSLLDNFKLLIWQHRMTTKDHFRK